MTEQRIECGMCWRRDNLTEAQRGDPANLITGTMDLCASHEALMNSVASTFFAIRDFGHFSPESTTEARKVTFALSELQELPDGR